MKLNGGDIVKKEDCPKFFSFNIFNIVFTIISLVALFGFWNKLSDYKKLIYLFIPSIIIIFVSNTIYYIIKVKSFYKKYEELYNNNQALSDNYKINVRTLKQEQCNNETLRSFSQKIINLLLIYGDLSKEEQTEVKKQIVTNFINEIAGKDIGDNNEKEV